jgi:hypothetical protein
MLCESVSEVFVYADFGVNIEKRRSPEVRWWRGGGTLTHIR